MRDWRDAVVADGASFDSSRTVPAAEARINIGRELLRNEGAAVESRRRDETFLADGNTFEAARTTPVPEARLEWEHQDRTPMERAVEEHQRQAQHLEQEREEERLREFRLEQATTDPSDSRQQDALSGIPATLSESRQWEGVNRPEFSRRCDDDREPVEALADARGLAASEFSGYRWGAGDREVDCVGFVAAVLEDLAENRRVELSQDFISRVYVRVSAGDVQAMVDRDDPQIRGVQSALVDAKLGVAVQPADAAPGDFVQYWYRNKQGDWAGHAGIVEYAEAGRVRLIGSHRSQGGIGTSQPIDLTDDSLRVYVGRWNR